MPRYYIEVRGHNYTNKAYDFDERDPIDEYLFIILEFLFLFLKNLEVGADIRIYRER